MPVDDDFSTLKRLAKHKSEKRPAPPALGDDMLAFFRKDIQKRLPKLEALASTWQKLIPSTIVHHTCLEGFHRGTLTVLVDSSPMLYELRQLLLAGIEKQLIVACKAQGLRKVSLRQGQWYDPRTGAPRF